jgi:hypothetical protein
VGSLVKADARQKTGAIRPARELIYLARILLFVRKTQQS